MAVPAPASSGSSTPVQPIQLYHQSSQYRHWRYSKEGLNRIRDELNQQAIERVRSMLEEERAQQQVTASTPADSIASTSESPSQPATPPPPSEVQYLTVADELALVTYYLTQASAMCTAVFKFPEVVSATAMSYLKRFYLRNTCMDYHPMNIMLTCVFLATKTENFPISIDAFASRVKKTPDDVLSFEFLVSQALKFEYKVHHAHLALQGLILDMQASASADLSALTAATPKAASFVRSSRLTPAELIYSPSQIALACFRLADPSLVDAWLGVKESKSVPAAPGGEKDEGGKLEHEGLIRVLEEIGAMVTEAQKNPVDKAKVKEIDMRLRWARNPEKDPKSALYKKRKAEEDAAREEKDRAKAAKRPNPEDDNPFK
ncbi:hypothetical protein JCM8097_004814 [Rhodosporidiobolus ruineniae]